jgi:hypothetical protein
MSGIANLFGGDGQTKKLINLEHALYVSVKKYANFDSYITIVFSHQLAQLPVFTPRKLLPVNFMGLK